MWTIRSMLVLTVLLMPVAGCADGAPGGESDAPAVDEGAQAAPTEAGPEEQSEVAVVSPEPTPAPWVTVGSKNFTESFILAHLYADALEDAGFQVQRKISLGTTDIAHRALLAGEIDLYPEYTSTGLLTVLQAEPLYDRAAIIEAVREGYRQRFELVWLEPAPMNNPQALATTQEVAEEHGLETYSDLAAAAPALTLGAPPEFAEREDGLPALQETYGGFEFDEVRGLDPGLRYPALREGEVDVVLAFGTDGQIAGYDLVLLEDDANLYPPYQPAPVVRQPMLDAYAEMADVLNAVSAELTSERMQALNWRVDGPEKAEPEDVAREFLQEHGLIDQ